MNWDYRIQKSVSESYYLLKQANVFLQIPIETMQDKTKSLLMLIGVIMVTPTRTLSVLCEAHQNGGSYGPITTKVKRPCIIL